MLSTEGEVDSHNCANFIGDDRELRELRLHVESQWVQEATVNKGVNWNLSTDGTKFRWRKHD